MRREHPRYFVWDGVIYERRGLLKGQFKRLRQRRDISVRMVHGTEQLVVQASLKEADVNAPPGDDG